MSAKGAIDREAQYFKWCVIILLAAYPIFALATGTFRSTISIIGLPALVAGGVFYLFIRVPRSIWVVGCILIALPLLGWAAFLSSDSDQELAGVAISAGYWADVLVTVLGALADDAIRRRRRLFRADLV
jgi:hypothetical protein